MKIRSLKLIVESNNIKKVYVTGTGESFLVPSEKYESVKTLVVYGDPEIGLIPEGGKYLVVDALHEFDPKVISLG